MDVLTGTEGGSLVLQVTTATGSTGSVESSLLEQTSSLGLSAVASGGNVLHVVVSALGWLLGQIVIGPSGFGETWMDVSDAIKT